MKTVEVTPRGFKVSSSGGAVGGRVWLDVDTNGFQDGGGRGIPGGEVRLYESGFDGPAGGGDNTALGTGVTNAFMGLDDGPPCAPPVEYMGHSCGHRNANESDQGGSPGTSGDFYFEGTLNIDSPVQLALVKKSDRYQATPSSEALEVGDRVTVSAARHQFLFPAVCLELHQGGALQEIGIHTACSQPLNVADQFGSLVLRAFQN